MVILKAGDKILYGNIGGRKTINGTITKVISKDGKIKEYVVTLDDGRLLICSEGHLLKTS
jgi:hypothetical protein